MTNKQIKTYLPELDLLRGLAALFMVINHIGYVLIPEIITLQYVQISTLLFITSYAPALFFFSSGVGSGLQSSSKSNQFLAKSIIYKFTLLMIADAFFAWGAGKLWGFDFLGFIAVIVILLELVRCSKFARSLCVLGVIVIFTLRFIIGPKLDFTGSNSFLSTISTWFIGVESLSWSSYPFSPWFTYPLIGFLLGTFIAKQYEILMLQKVRNHIFLIIIGFLFSTLSYYLSTHEYGFFRWGTMSFAFYCLSFAVIPFSLLIASHLHHLNLKKYISLLYLSGTASLAIVPVHYFLIHHAKKLDVSSNYNNYQYILLSISILFCSFILAKLMDKVAKKIQSKVNSIYAVPTFFVTITVLAITTYCFSLTIPTLANLTQTLGQLTICILFSVRLKNK